ncbi:ssDNA exonuclease RecJ, partial [Salmonella enterica subsp. enterica serovar Anatum str. USDA 100]
ADLPPLLRRLYASRGVRSARELERSVKGMLPWQQLSGIDNAVEILYNAFREGIRIIVVGDFDADGATSTALKRYLGIALRFWDLFDNIFSFFIFFWFFCLFNFFRFFFLRYGLFTVFFFKSR